MFLFFFASGARGRASGSSVRFVLGFRPHSGGRMRFLGAVLRPKRTVRQTVRLPADRQLPRPEGFHRGVRQSQRASGRRWQFQQVRSANVGSFCQKTFAKRFGGGGVEGWPRGRGKMLRGQERGTVGGHSLETQLVPAQSIWLPNTDGRYFNPFLKNILY